ncbi:hypothetical protein APY04_0833 [Hyphomicrobium sulfonivorans]|uniref:Phage protein n=1 Tax=Hyphomicrobium sulfonivorans TaxID=121290 RepID=A0A109BMP2_HYPSL|nr:DUF4128 domain-containing protein [Hyphomicrobium sulfonivorans]KWT70772.1 hypothetical protein APY04_0833 [Hyphomicrobium sulfonivorans]
MLTGTHARIADLLLSHLGTLTFTPAIPVAFPGVSFTPPAGTYLKAIYIPNTTLDHFISDGSTSEYRGIFQVSVRSPAGVSIIAPLEIAAKVSDHFKRGTVLSDGTLNVRISGTPNIASPIQEPDKLHVPVSISFYAFK